MTHSSTINGSAIAPVEIIRQKEKMITQAQINNYMMEGSTAFTKGLKTKDNPYNAHSEKGRLWLRGYINSAWATDLTKGH